MAVRGRSDPGSGSGTPRYPGSFLLAFREASAQLQWQFQRLLNDMAHCIDAEGKEHFVGLENLYRRAKRTPREQWPELISEFLQTVCSAESAENLPADLASVADQLLVRLGKPIKLEDEEARVWAQAIDGTDLVANIVIDYPNRMCYVTDRLVETSGRPGSEWFQQACSNLLARTPGDCLQVVHEESGMRICNVADAYDSSRVFLLDALLPEAKENGCLVVIPGRDELLALPITMKAIPHMHLLKAVAEKNHRGAPYPISEDVYWIHGGNWRKVPIDIKSDEVTVQPPPELIDVLNRLAEQHEGSDQEQ